MADEDDEQRRLIAACTDCGALYAATELSDGSILPIGQRDGCRCGNTSFTPVDEDLLGAADESDLTGDDERESSGGRGSAED